MSESLRLRVRCSRLRRWSSRIALGTYLLGLRRTKLCAASCTYAPRARFASRTALGTYLRCHARVVHCACAARSQCVYCGACGPFSRVGLPTVGVPWQRPAKSCTPTLRVDTLPPQEGDHMHQHTTSLSSTDLPGGRSTEDPGAPLLSAVCVSPSSQQPPGPGAAKIRKTLRGYPPGEKTTCGKCQNYIPQISPPGGYSANRKMPQNGPNTEAARRTTKSRVNQ